ncbi:MAG TPA: cupredoxin domain-containing protein [Acidimicrobiia bacterium]|nr:cupredoxin domain-containing protein [Acidimicrobiia bacterium]
MTPTTSIRPVVFALAVAVAAGACGGRDSNASGDAPIRIVNFQFEPKTLTVEPGAKVTWTNDDTAVHSIKDTSRLATPVSQDLPKGGTFSITYEQPGSYSYICGIHQYMTGSVTVAS